ISESAYKRLNPPVGGQAIKRNKRISESAFGSPPVGAKHLSPDTASAVLMCRDGETVLETPRTPPSRVKIALERGAVGWAVHWSLMSNYYRVYEITVHHLKCRLKRFGNSRGMHLRCAKPSLRALRRKHFQRRVLSTFAVKSTSPAMA